MWPGSRVVGYVARLAAMEANSGAAVAAGQSLRAINNSPVRRLPHLLLAQDHGGPIALNPTAQKKDLRPAEAWFRVTVEGEDDAPVDGVREVRAHFEGTRESLARRWVHAATAVLIEQSGF